MNQKELDFLLSHPKTVEENLTRFALEKTLLNQKVDPHEIQGHLEKAAHNLDFVQDNLKLGYLDWCITGCYYASYHAALALIMTKGYSSKSHMATLCVLIKEFYKQGVSAEDIKLLHEFFLDYQDLMFYVESKNKREEATYSSKRMFDKKTAQDLRLKAALFVDRIKNMIQ